MQKSCSIQSKNVSNRETGPQKKPLIPKGITIQPSTLPTAAVT